jgi:hypothetical protein
MKNLARFALTISAAALFAGCGGSQPPIGALGAMPQSRAIATHADRGGSWMLPEAKSEDLLYVTGDGESYVFPMQMVSCLRQLAPERLALALTEAVMSSWPRVLAWSNMHMAERVLLRT